MVLFAPHAAPGFGVCERVSAPEAYAGAASVPDPFDEADALEALEEEIAILAAHIHAATHRLLVLVAEFERRRGWELGGHRSCAHWLSVRTGIDLGTAREKVRTARALVELPLIGASMSRGELSFSAVRALSRVATPESEGDLLELARGCTTAQIERLVRGWKLGSREDEEARERERYGSRTLSVFPDDDGMYVVRGRLTPELGTLLMRAVEAASDALYREHDYRNVSPETSHRAAARRRADALALVAERALAAGFAATPDRGEEAEAGSGTGGDSRLPLSGTRAERYQVLLHVDADTLMPEGEPGRSELDDGTRVSPMKASASRVQSDPFPPSKSNRPAVLRTARLGRWVKARAVHDSDVRCRSVSACPATIHLSEVLAS